MAQQGIEGDSIFLSALECFEKQQFNEAIKLFNEYISENPQPQNRAASFYFLGLSYFFTNQYNLAMNSIIQAQQIGLNEQQKVISLYFLGRIEYSRGNYNYAISYFKNFVDNSASSILKVNAYFFLWQAYTLKQDKVYASKYKELFEKEIAKTEFQNLSAKESMTSKDNAYIEKYAQMNEKLYISQTLIEQYKEIILELTKDWRVDRVYHQ